MVDSLIDTIHMYMLLYILYYGIIMIMIIDGFRGNKCWKYIIWYIHKQAIWNN